jgi:hypothetical protein
LFVLSLTNSWVRFLSLSVLSHGLFLSFNVVVVFCVLTVFLYVSILSLIFRRHTLLVCIATPFVSIVAVFHLFGLITFHLPKIHAGGVHIMTNVLCSSSSLFVAPLQFSLFSSNQELIHFLNQVSWYSQKDRRVSQSLPVITDEPLKWQMNKARGIYMIQRTYQYNAPPLLLRRLL